MESLPERLSLKLPGSRIFGNDHQTLFMLAEERDYVIVNRKFKRSFQDYLNYFFLVFPLAIAFIGCAMFSGYLMHREEDDLLLVSLCFMIFGLFGTYYVFKRLSDNISFTSIPYDKNIDWESFCEKLKTAFRRGQVFPDKNLNVIVLVTGTSAFSWGERVTLIFDGENVLVNSQPAGSQPITILKDGMNIRKIKRLIEGV